MTIELIVVLVFIWVGSTAALFVLFESTANPRPITEIHHHVHCTHCDQIHNFISGERRGEWWQWTCPACGAITLDRDPVPF